jgi:hypothetical protein
MNGKYSGGHSDRIRRFKTIDRRSTAWRRRVELIKEFAAQLPNLTETQWQDVERLCDLIVLAEGKRIAMLAGEQIDLFGLARLENTID